MPSYRNHLITGEPILFAPERAGRPNAFGAEDVDICPFCPGNEALTPPEIESTGNPWRVRVFANKYPSVAGHEVIVESPDHGASFEAIGHAEEILETYVRRYRAHEEAAFVSIIRNQGRAAGASIGHLHSQLMPLPFVPPRAEREMAAFASAGVCPLCAAIEKHRESGLVIAETGSVVRLAPSGSSHAYEQWVIPLRHQPEMTGLDADEMIGLSRGLRDGVRAAKSVAAAHNVLFMNFRRRRSAHMYVAIVPRLAALAGFELATGMFIDIIDPCAATRALR